MKWVIVASVIILVSLLVLAFLVFYDGRDK